jgi:hypothetical protein
VTVWTPFQKFDTLPDGGECFENNRYVVIKRFIGQGGLGPLYHLSIRTQQRTTEHDWREFQRIKNELIGPEAEAVELYPAESRLVDTSNQYHLWVFPEFRFPFGMNERLLTETPVAENSVQRPFVEKPDGLLDEAKTKAKLENHFETNVNGAKGSVH